MVIFASMGGMLFGLDQSTISGANLEMPTDLNLDSNQVSLISSLMPLGAVFGSFLLGPANEILGRKGAILLAVFFYTVGAALEAAAQNFAMMVSHLGGSEMTSCYLMLSCVINYTNTVI
jgi:MFS family permease